MTERITKDALPSREVKASLEAWEMWVGMSEPERLAVILAQYPPGAWYDNDPTTGENLLTLSHFRQEPQWGAIKQRFKEIGGNPFDLQHAVDAFLAQQRNGHGPTPAQELLPPPETLTDLLAADIPPPVHLFDGLMHEGMLLFGGKSKRGKSWLMFDLALSLAVGRSAFRHFGCKQSLPVLFLALEDGRARLQGRTRLIQPNLTTVNNFHLRYSFRPLLEGGIEDLAQEITRYHYGLVVIDVLAKLEPTNGGKGEKNYHDVYEMFAPLQALRQQHPFCLAMLTHLRKQEADDVFDNLHGSVAYQGAQDVLWVLERKPKDDYAFLHIRDKDAEDQTIALRFLDGHWEYIGEGEEYEVSRDQRKVIKILTEERREMGVQEILRAGDFKTEQYGYLRKLCSMMVKEDLIHRTRYGKYSATVRGSIEMGGIDDPEDVDEEGSRVPF